MRVGIFTDNDFEKVNGVTTSLRAVMEHAPEDLRIRVYTCDSQGVDTPGYLSLRALGFGIPYYAEMKMYVPPLRELLRRAESDRLDVIHLTTPGPLGLAAIWIASRLRIPLIGSFHTHLAEYAARLSGSKQLGALMEQYLRWPYGRCRVILAPSQSTRALLIAAKMDPAKIRLWERGVSTVRFNPARRSERLRERWGVSNERPAILYVGRLSREKGLADMAAVRDFLAGHRVPHRLVFVGAGPMRAELESLCPDAVFTGALSSEAVATAMAAADLFLFPSRTDTAGNVVLEAQASGLPVLVTDEGGPRENIRQGVTGIVSGSVRELCQRTRELCLDQNRRRRMGEAAREYALERRWETALEPLYQAYRDVATGGVEMLGTPRAAPSAA